MFSFAGKTVLLSGGTSGIGLAAGRAFQHAGATVYAAGIPPLPDDPGIRFIPLDVRDSGAIDDLIAGLPSLDVLVNAAGIIRRDEEFQPDVFEDVLDINLHGTMRLCMSARGLLRASGGCIVNVASMLSFFGGARVPAYTASKGAVAQLTKALAVAWAAEGIRVNAVAPGWVATPLTEALQEDPERSGPLLARTPMRRWGQPEEISPAVLFLCSEAASFITGSILTVDGGYSAA